MWTLFVKNLKPISYIVIAIMTGFVLWGLHTTIKDNGRYEGIIESQKLIIQDQTLQIETLGKIIDLTNNIIIERDNELDKLEEQMQGLTDDLGEGSGDLAPSTQREYFKRLETK